MKITCNKPGCRLTGAHDHLEVVNVREAKPEPKPEPIQEPVQEVMPDKPSLMSLLGDAIDECAGVSESFTGKPSSLRETAKKVRKVNTAGEKLGKLGQAVQDSKLPAVGKKIIQTLRDNTRMREYGK